jgi:hypothetical protein
MSGRASSALCIWAVVNGAIVVDVVGLLSESDDVEISIPQADVMTIVTVTAIADIADRKPVRRERWNCCPDRFSYMITSMDFGPVEFPGFATER